MMKNIGAGLLLNLFRIACMIGLAMAFASPNPATARPVARPFLSSNQSIRVLTGDR